MGINIHVYIIYIDITYPRVWDSPDKKKKIERIISTYNIVIA